MSRKIGLALMVAAGLPVCAARAAEVSSGAEFAAVLAGGESEIALTRDIMLASGIGTQTAENMALDGNGHSLTGNNDLDSLSIAKGKTRGKCRRKIYGQRYRTGGRQHLCRIYGYGRPKEICGFRRRI